VRGKDQVRGFSRGSSVYIPAGACGGALRRLGHGSFLDRPAALNQEICKKIADRALVVRR
jgi:hypothetical protein